MYRSHCFIRAKSSIFAATHSCMRTCRRWCIKWRISSRRDMRTSRRRGRRGRGKVTWTCIRFVRPVRSLCRDTCALYSAFRALRPPANLSSSCAKLITNLSVNKAIAGYPGQLPCHVPSEYPQLFREICSMWKAVALAVTPFMQVCLPARIRSQR